MRPLSLTTRVTLLTVGAMVVATVTISAVAYHELEESLSHSLGAGPGYVRHEMGEFLRMMLVLGAVTLAVLAALVAVSVSLAMKPIRKTARRLSDVTHRNLGAEHLAGIDAPRELVPFVEGVRQMLARLDEGVQAQRRFIADASHELRTPLAVAKSTVQSVRLSGRTTEEYRQALDDVLADLDRLNGLVSQLLDLARLEEAGPGPAEDVAVGPLLEALAEAYEAPARAAGDRIVVSPSDPALRVRACPADLDRLFGNLLDNAIKHGPRNGTIALRAEESRGSCVVSVHDEGGLIPPDQIERMFGRFRRADDSRSRATGGAGLGLAIARQVALRYGGDIHVTSSPGDGTTVKVGLPLGGDFTS